MPRVIFTENLQRHVNLAPRVVDGATVREALDNVFRDNAVARGYVLDEHGALRKHMIIFVAGNMIEDRVTLSDRVNADTEIYVIQALSGG